MHPYVRSISLPVLLVLLSASAHAQQPPPTEPRTVPKSPRDLVLCALKLVDAAGFSTELSARSDSLFGFRRGFGTETNLQVDEISVTVTTRPDSTPSRLRIVARTRTESPQRGNFGRQPSFEVKGLERAIGSACSPRSTR